MQILIPLRTCVGTRYGAVGPSRCTSYGNLKSVLLLRSNTGREVLVLRGSISPPGVSCIGIRGISLPRSCHVLGLDAITVTRKKSTGPFLGYRESYFCRPFANPSWLQLRRRRLATPGIILIWSPVGQAICINIVRYVSACSSDTTLHYVAHGLHALPRPR